MNTPTLITLPSSARRGEVITVRATIAHPMENGYRIDARGQPIPRRIITRFECRMGRVIVFAADLYPALSANPVISFTLRAMESAPLEFVWRGDEGFEHRHAATLVVA